VSRPLRALTDSNSLLRSVAFHLLLNRRQPVAPDELAKASGFELDRTIKLLEDLDRDGRIRRDATGHVVGSAGLSVTRDRHEIDLAGRTFWIWCAYDMLGIFGALHASGAARPPSPPDRALIELRFLDGRPQDSDTVVFRPAEELMSTCDNVYEEWCPYSNLFSSRDLAQAWAVQHQISGRVLSLAEASDLAADEWQDVVRRLSA
jgi:hypothetical protein